MQKADTIIPEEDTLSSQDSKETSEEDSPARETIKENSKSDNSSEEAAVYINEDSTDTKKIKDIKDTTFENIVHTELNKDINEQIYDDYNKGLSVSELASKYKKGKGEVELRLNLKK